MTNIDSILADLYQIDPTLKQHERELKAILQNVIASKPNIVPDAAFAKNLRQQLAARADILSQPTSRQTGFPYLSVFSGTIAVIALVLVGAQYYSAHKNTTPATTAIAPQLLTDTVEVDHIAKNAFGSLAINELNTRNQSGGGGPAASTANTTMTAPAPTTAPSNGTENSPKIAYGMGGGGAAADIGIMPPFTQYTYTYTGGDLPKLDNQMDVYKKLKGFSDNVNTANLLKQLKVGLLNTGKFSNLVLQNFTVAEDKEFGYMLAIDPVNGTLSINQNWEKWPHPEQSCQDQRCFDQYRLQPSDIPADDRVIAIANQFLKDYGLSTANYGTPVVQSDWVRAYEATPDKSQAYVPDNLTVVYPFQLNGQSVYDEGGRLSGLNVMVDVRNKKVAGVSEISNQKYQASAYDTETNNERILSLAAKGGFRSYSYDMPGAKTVTVELGTPTLAYIHMYFYQNNQNSELLIPAYVFPVTKAPTDQPYFSNTVIVPVIKEILDDAANTGSPIPFMDSQPAIMK